MERKRYMKFLRVGVGGWSCPCCAPPRGKRRELFRAARLREEREAFKVEEENLYATEMDE